MITATNKATGELIELPVSTPLEIVKAWKIAQEYEKTSEALKAQLKELVPNLVGEKGVSEPIDGSVFRISHIQRMAYDKSVVRQEFDEDTFDLFTKIDKAALNQYIKENLETLGEKSTILRQSMIPEGASYQVIKLERIT